MRKDITEPEFDRCFDQLWAALKSEFFKCETRSEYSEPGEEELLALFRAGKFPQLRKAFATDTAQDGSVWQDARTRGIDFLRVHVFSEPLSEYLRFELVAYEIQAAAGERIWMTTLDSLTNGEKADLRDFMLFDTRTALIVDHNVRGQIVGATVTDEPADILPLKKLRANLLQAGTPLEEFLARQKPGRVHPADRSGAKR